MGFGTFCLELADNLEMRCCRRFCVACLRRPRRGRRGPKAVSFGHERGVLGESIPLRVRASLVTAMVKSKLSGVTAWLMKFRGRG